MKCKYVYGSAFRGRGSEHYYVDEKECSLSRWLLIYSSRVIIAVFSVITGFFGGLVFFTFGCLLIPLTPLFIAMNINENGDCRGLDFMLYMICSPIRMPYTYAKTAMMYGGVCLNDHDAVKW